MRRLGLSLAAVALVAGCSVGHAVTVVNPGGAATAIPPTTTVNYCTPAGSTALSADLWVPTAATGTSPKTVPIVVFAHGGGWIGGKRTDGLSLAGLLPKLLEQGIAFASIDYRLYGPPTPDRTVTSVDSIPKIVPDAACAVRFFRANADRWHLDPERVGVLGESAGAYLMLMVGLADSSAGIDVGEWLDQSSKPQAVGSIAGPTDLTVPNKSNSDPNVLTGFGATSVKDPIMKHMSPVTRVSPDDPPVFIVQGDRDQRVEFDQGPLLYNRLREAGVATEFVPVERADHDFNTVEMEPAWPSIFERAADFYVKYLGGPE